MYYVYILECNDGSLYTGITTDVARRFKEHVAGVGAKYTKARTPVRIAYQEKHPDRSSASKREAEIKGYTRERKMAVISKK